MNTFSYCIPVICGQASGVFPSANQYASFRLEFGHESGTIHSDSNDTEPLDHFVDASACFYPDCDLKIKINNNL